MKHVLRSPLVALPFAMLLLAAPSAAHGQSLDTVLTMATGSGISLGRGEAGAVRQMSPIFLDFDVGLILDDDRTLEWTPSLIMELGDRVSVGINPSLKRVFQFRWFSAYGGIGTPFFFAPYTLFGVQAALGGFVPIFDNVSVAFEWRTDVFFVGNDLPKDSALVKLDVAVGLRVDL